MKFRDIIVTVTLALTVASLVLEIIDLVRSLKKDDEQPALPEAENNE